MEVAGYSLYLICTVTALQSCGSLFPFLSIFFLPKVTMITIVVVVVHCSSVLNENLLNILHFELQLINVTSLGKCSHLQWNLLRVELGRKQFLSMTPPHQAPKSVLDTWMAFPFAYFWDLDHANKIYGFQFKYLFFFCSPNLVL